MPYGLQPSGFLPKPLENIKSDLDSAFRALWGAAIDTEAESVIGQFVGIFADRLADLWQGQLGLYSAAFVESASGIDLDNLVALAGIARNAATYSEVVVILSGTPATVIASGKQASVTGIGTKFALTAPATIGGGGTVTVTLRATATGPLVAPGGTVTTIETPVAGWTGVNNALDQSILGKNVESDSALRLRFVTSLRAIGLGSAQAIRARVLEVKDVTDCFVFENTSDTTDVNSVPGHAFEVVVDGGLGASIAQKIYDVKPAGIASYGTSSATIGSLTIKYSRPVDLNIYVVASIKVDSNFPADGDAQIKQAIVDAEDLRIHVGSQVISSILVPTILSIPGVTDVPSLPFIGTAPAPGTATTISPTNHQKARFDTTRIAITHV